MMRAALAGSFVFFYCGECCNHSPFFIFYVFRLLWSWQQFLWL